MRTLQLSNSPQLALIDDEDYERVQGYNWKLHRPGSITKKPYVVMKCCINGKDFIMALHHALIGQPITGLTDHRDRNPLNNQKSNLRHCTYRQNAQNVSTKRNGLKGVYFNPRSKRNPWVAQIVVDGRKLWLGSFPTEQQGHEVYCQAATKYFGEFASYG